MSSKFVPIGCDKSTGVRALAVVRAVFEELAGALDQAGQKKTPLTSKGGGVEGERIKLSSQNQHSRYNTRLTHHTSEYLRYLL